MGKGPLQECSPSKDCTTTEPSGPARILSLLQLRQKSTQVLDLSIPVSSYPVQSCPEVGWGVSGLPAPFDLQTLVDTSGYLLHGKWGPAGWILGHIHSIPCPPPAAPGVDPLQLGHHMSLGYHAVSLFSFTTLRKDPLC